MEPEFEAWHSTATAGDVQAAVREFAGTDREGAWWAYLYRRLGDVIGAMNAPAHFRIDERGAVRDAMEDDHPEAGESASSNGGGVHGGT